MSGVSLFIILGVTKDILEIFDHILGGVDIFGVVIFDHILRRVEIFDHILKRVEIFDHILGRGEIFGVEIFTGKGGDIRSGDI